MGNSTSASVSLVYGALRHRCGPGHLPGPWGAWSAEACCRKCPEDLTSLLGELAARFSRKVLLQSGVAIASNDGQLHPSPMLVPGGWLVFLKGEKGRTFDVLTPAGCLSGNLPVLSVWNDRWTKQALERWGRMMLVAGSLEDAVVFRTLGFAAATAAGLDEIHPDALAELCAQFDWGLEPYSPTTDDETGEDENPSDPPEAAEPAALVLATWSSTRLQIEASPAIEAATRSFQTLYGRGLTRMDVGAWAPSNDYLNRLRLQVAVFRDEVSAEEMFADLEGHTTVVESPATPTMPPPANLQEAWDALCRAEYEAKAKRGTKEEVRRAQNALEDCLERELLRPLSRPDSDPLSAHLRLVLQQLSRLFRRAARQADATLQQLPPDALSSGGLSKLVAPVVQTASSILTVTKEVRVCDHAAGRRPDWLQSARWPTLN